MIRIAAAGSKRGRRGTNRRKNFATVRKFRSVLTAMIAAITADPAPKKSATTPTAVRNVRSTMAAADVYSIFSSPWRQLRTTPAIPSQSFAVPIINSSPFTSPG